MGSRMDKYKNEDLIPTRSDKNKELYRQIYNAYDEFENLIVPPNSREINMSDLKKEITSREEYRERKEYNDIRKKENSNDTPKKREQEYTTEKQDNGIYDINELLNKAVVSKNGPDLIETTLSNGDYLKKLKLDNRRTNIEQVKEIYDDIKEETMEEDESLLKTANLSLEILSDLKSDNDATMVSAPIKDEELPDDSNDMDFYSSNYKFSKRDFVDNEYEEDDDDDDEEDDDSEENGGGKFFFKILLLIFGILLIIGVLLYFIYYFNRV